MDPQLVTAPEPARDIRAQLRAVLDPRSGKQSAFLANGTPLPDYVPEGLTIVQRPEGTLVTTDSGHANTFARVKHLTAEVVAALLGYPQTKREALRDGAPVVVQARVRGAVVWETVASGPGIPAAVAAALQAVPNARIRVMTAETALRRRRRLT
jgi:hypothetical protein